jgi:hypothetical protein
MVTAAVESGDPKRVREVVAQSGVELPVYLASPDSLRRFSAPSADPPLNVLVDADGQIIAMARGAGDSMLDRLADQAKRLLDELDPMGNTRFAERAGSVRSGDALFQLTNPRRHELVEQGMRPKRRPQVEAHLRMPGCEVVARGPEVALEMDPR